MFTGIVETLGKVSRLEQDRENLHITIKSNFTQELKIDQSVAHNGACLTVVEISNDEYVVTAIKETIDKTNLGNLNVSDEVNLERCVKTGQHLDGHVVQGHVDTVGECVDIIDEDGSFKFFFKYTSNDPTVKKGSVTVNGVSLTVVDSEENLFSVAIIPYTLDNTTFKNIKIGTKVNLEFDIIGKYVKKLIKPYQ